MAAKGRKGVFAGELSMALISATQRFIRVRIFALLRGKEIRGGEGSQVIREARNGPSAKILANMSEYP
ncbi:hypothetical protein OPIT5_22855 [Opitutaceae bacterium TAV5]|nr:hypothetical protein OPIT5_22855 [Opitutaceae bacterium TAV5]